MFDTISVYFNKYQRLNSITTYISCLTYQLFTKQYKQSLKSSLYSENVISVKQIKVEQRVINNTIVLLITMQRKINKTYVTIYKTVYENKETF